MANWEKYTGTGAVNGPEVETPTEENPVPPIQQPETKDDNVAAEEVPAPLTQSSYGASITGNDGSYAPQAQSVYGANYNGNNSNYAPQAQSEYTEKNAKTTGKTLHRFPKGWIIFMIVAASCAMATFLPVLADNTNDIDALLIFLYLGGIITGYVLMLRKKALGFLIAFIGNFLLFFKGQTHIGNYLTSPTIGLPLTIVSFFITMKQIDYRFWKYIKIPELKARIPKPAQPEITPTYNETPTAQMPLNEQAPVITQMPVNVQAPAAAQVTVNAQAPVIAKMPVEEKKPKREKVPKPQKEHATFNMGPDAQAQPKARANWLVIGGIAAFAVVVVAVLYVGLIRPVTQNELAEMADAHEGVQSQGSIQSQSSTASTEQKAGLTAEEEKLFEEIKVKLTEQFQESAKKDIGDPLVCAAVENILYEEPIFDTGRILVTVLLPDPRKSSLDSLNIAPYVPFSGAQAYIKEAYQSLKNINTITNYIGFEVSLSYKSVYIDTKEIDWSFHHGTFALRDYMQIFEPHMDEYMKELGFFVAAREILMPDFSACSDEFLKSYYASLADALSIKGVYHMNKATINTAQIEQLLEERFGQCFVYDGLAFDKFGYEPTIKMTTFTHMSFFHDAFQFLDNQYETGRATPPETFEATEAAYLAMVKQMIGDMYGELSKGTTQETMEHSFKFNWEKLGDEGIAACTDLIDEIEYFMQFYDSSLMMLDHFVGMRIYSQ